MPRFFIDAVPVSDGKIALTGTDAHHISRSLRMAAGERITVCDGKGTEYVCELTDFLPGQVCARVLWSLPSASEPPYRAVVFQALAKGDKLDVVIQKAVECGAHEIALFESERCVVRMRGDEKEGRQDRRSRIALEAAKQSGRGVIPRVRPPVGFSEALAQAARAELPLFCYEGEGTEPLPAVLRRFRAGRANRVPGMDALGRDAPSAAPELPGNHVPTVSVMVGSEGGFSPAEAEQARAAGMCAVGLGRRILRTETAAAFVLACLSYELELSEMGNHQQ